MPNDYGCPKKPQAVRLIRHGAPIARFPSGGFGDMYQQRWSILKSFKRLKRRLNFEHLTGLSQHAVEPDVAVKNFCDNLQALTAAPVLASAHLADSARIDHAYVHTAIKP